MDKIDNCLLCGEIPKSFNYRPELKGYYGSDFFYCPNRMCKNYTVGLLNKYAWNGINKKEK